MPSVYINNDTYQSLLTHLEGGEIGCVTATEGDEQWKIYIMYGAIVGATSNKDNAQFVRRLKLNGNLNDAQARALDTVIRAEKPILNLLFEMLPEEALAEILYDRYIENIAMYLANPGTCHYEKMQAIFIDNLQMGHVATEIVQTCSILAETAFQLDPSTRLIQLNASISDELSARILSIFASAQYVHEALNEIPLEPLASLCILKDLMSSGHLGYARIKPPEDEEPEIVGQSTIFTETPPERRVRAQGFVNQPIVVPDFPEEDPQPESSLVNAHTETWEDPIVEELTEEIDRTPAPAPRRLGNGDSEVSPESDSPSSPSSLADWSPEDSFEDSDVMEAFQDYDVQRGGGDGGFTSASQHLDRIDFGTALPDDDIQEDASILEVTDGMEHLFSEEIARQKIEVANEVLTVVSAAFDKTSDMGTGPRTIQTLIESAPYPYKFLFDSVTATASGAMSEDRMLSNLQSKPIAEQRRALHQAVLDIISRALSFAADELDDDEVDMVLSNTQGYRKRLGR